MVRKGKWLSGRRRQAVNLLVLLALVRIQLFSHIINGYNKIFLHKYRWYSFRRSKKIKYIRKRTISLNKNFIPNYEFYPNIIKLKPNKTNYLKLNTTNKIIISRLLSYIYVYRKVYAYHTLNLIYYKHIILQQTILKNKILNLNFKRARFFPSLRSYFYEGLYIAMSLGLLSKYFLKPKCFTKNKTIYLALAAFLRKVLLYCSFPYLYLTVTRTPRYFNEILAKIMEPAVSLYKDPFSPKGEVVSENKKLNNFTFSALFFFTPKKYGLVKTRKRGRLKRKIHRRLILLNRVLD